MPTVSDRSMILIDAIGNTDTMIDIADRRYRKNR